MLANVRAASFNFFSVGVVVPKGGSSGKRSSPNKGHKSTVRTLIFVVDCSSSSILGQPLRPRGVRRGGDTTQPLPALLHPHTQLLHARAPLLCTRRPHARASGTTVKIRPICNFSLILKFPFTPRIYFTTQSDCEVSSKVTVRIFWVKKKGKSKIQVRSCSQAGRRCTACIAPKSAAVTLRSAGRGNA